MRQVEVNPATLVERLERAGQQEPLMAEAAARIKHLEELCAMMTDTGVILEEDVQDLTAADTWWLPEDDGVAYTCLQQAMEENAVAGQVLEWCRAHTLENGWAMLCEELKDHNGRVVVHAGVKEFHTLEQAEAAAAEYAMLRRRAEYNL